MGEPQDWAPYSSVEDAAKVYLRDPELALEQLRSVVDFRSIKSFIMSRGASEESWGDAVWQEVVLTDGERLIAAFKKETGSATDKWFYFQYVLADGKLIMSDN